MENTKNHMTYTTPTISDSFLESKSIVSKSLNALFLELPESIVTHHKNLVWDLITAYEAELSSLRSSLEGVEKEREEMREALNQCTPYLDRIDSISSEKLTEKIIKLIRK